MECIFSPEPMTPAEVIDAIETIVTINEHVEVIYGSWLYGGEFGEPFDPRCDHEKKESDDGNADDDDVPGVSGNELYDPEDIVSDLALHMEECTIEADQQDIKQETLNILTGPEPLGLENSDSEFTQPMEISIPEGSDMELTDCEGDDYY